jgi:thioredoxin reductase
MNHLLEHKKVAIIGGGPGGLTLANLLQQKELLLRFMNAMPINILVNRVQRWICITNQD